MQDIKRMKKSSLKRLFLAIIVILLPAILISQMARVQDVQAFEGDEYMVGKVIEIEEKLEMDDYGYEDTYQEVTVDIKKGSEKGQEIKLNHGYRAELMESEQVEKGDKVIILKTELAGAPITAGSSAYFISGFYRLPALLMVFVIFVALVALFGRRQGLRSILGLIFSILVLAKFIIPMIIAGGNPLFYTLVGALIIMFISIYLSHGFHARTTIALIGTMITVTIAMGLSVFFVHITKLFGTGSEDAFSLQTFGALENLNLQGLLLGGIIIGTLGVLDDITVSQSAIIDELKKANNKLTVRELYDHGISVGREHIASLVNTLVLAYAGASLPIFIMFSINETMPFLLMLNTEFVAEEIVRTLVGSSALVLAVPITTALAAIYFDTHPSPKNTSSAHIHKH